MAGATTDHPTYHAPSSWSNHVPDNASPVVSVPLVKFRGRSLALGRRCQLDGFSEQTIWPRVVTHHTLERLGPVLVSAGSAGPVLHTSVEPVAVIIFLTGVRRGGQGSGAASRA